MAAEKRDLTRARLVVCAPSSLPTYFDDDVRGICALCARAVRHRPHIPTPAILVCLTCFLVHAEPGAEVEITGESLEELSALGIATWP